MRVADIGKVLDLTWAVRQNGRKFIPNFEGPAGIGKSQAVHQWCKAMAEKIPGFRMIDQRCALLDPTDLQGLPWKDDTLGVTKFLPPDILPRDGHGVLFLDEINRSNQPVMNALMQILTEYAVGASYKLPPGWVIVTATNPPDGEAYDVNNMDAALQDRIRTFKVRFDHKTFKDFAKSQSWPATVLSYLDSGQWVYKEPGTGDGHYISPRGWEDLAVAEMAGAMDDTDIHHELCLSILGKNIGQDYWNFCHKTRPIQYGDLLKDFEASGKKKDKIKELPSFKDFEKYGNPKQANSYRADLLSATFQSFVNEGKKVDDNILIAVVDVMPIDQSAALLHSMSFKHDDPAAWLLSMKSRFPDTFARIRTVTSKKQGASNAATK